MEHKIPPKEQWTQQYLCWVSALLSTKNVLGNGNNTTFIMQQINSGAFFNCLSSISVVSQHTSALENVQTYIWNNSF